MALLSQRSPRKNFLSHPLNFVRFQQISSYVGTEAQRAREEVIKKTYR